MSAFDVVDQSNLRIVGVHGEIDGTNAHDFELACSDAHVTRNVVVDLSTCSYIDSTGLTALVRASRHKSLTLVLEPTCRVYRIFAITGLLGYFNIAATMDEVARGAVDERMTATALEHEAAPTFAV